MRKTPSECPPGQCDFDLVVIGSGPAGEMAAVEAGHLGKKVALIEKENVLGGAATNTGTIPSKTLRETALFLAGSRQRSLYGIDLKVSTRDISARELLYHERHVVENEREKIRSRLEQQRVEIIMGKAAFQDPHTVLVTRPDSATRRLSAGVILIATGSRPFRPPVFPAECQRIYDSDTILDIDALPKSLLVIGAGIIGCEYASVFASLGTAVTLINSQEETLPFLDCEIRELLESALVTNGIDLIKSARVSSVSNEPDRIVATTESWGSFSAEALLIATGRASNSDGLGLDEIGVGLGKRGIIEVDAHYRTSVPHIYAAGDVIGFPALASTSIGQARIAVEHAFRPEEEESAPTVLPFGIYTIPECAMAGETEEQLRARGVEFVAGRGHYADNARGLIIGEAFGLLKLLFERETRRLLGVHIIGEQATELVHTGVVALEAGLGADLLLRCCFNYPTLSDLYKHATFDAFGKPDIE